MSLRGDSSKDNSANTYMVQDDRKKKAEVLRLVLQDSMITTAMGGVLPEQPDPHTFRRVLDVACGTGGWMLQATQTYPDMNVTGVDINTTMIEYARTQAKTQGLESRATFQVMDALKKLEFPDNTFDLANLRFGTSFIRTWDWPPLLLEMQRVVRPGGIVRITDGEVVTQNTSQALTDLYGLAMQAFYRAGHLFTQEGAGVTNHLAELLTKSWCDGVQTRAYPLVFRAGTPEGKMFKEDLEFLRQTTTQFVKKWVGLPANYEALYQQSQKDMEKPDFSATWPHLVAWGHKPLATAK